MILLNQQMEPKKVSEQLNNLIVKQYELVLTFAEDALLPYYPGSTLRGSFGHAFLKVACPFSRIIKQRLSYNITTAAQKNIQSAHECPLGEKCLYMQIFETPPPKDTEMMTKYTQAPHPFVLEPDWNGKRAYKAGEQFKFGLTLIGKAIQYLPYFVYAFVEHGKVGMGTPRAKYNLSKVFTVNNGEKFEIFDTDEAILKKDTGSIDHNQTNSCHTNLALEANCNYTASINASHKTEANSTIDSLTLQFVTPTRLKYNEHLAPKPEFHIVIRNLLRRLSLLSYFHCGFKLELPFKELIDEATNVKMSNADVEWVDWERYSSRQNTRMTLGGFIGNVTYEGNLSRFLPYLTAGELTHVGKGATFGLGRYEIEILD